MPWEKCEHCNGTGHEPPPIDACVVMQGADRRDACSRGIRGCRKQHVPATNVEAARYAEVARGCVVAVISRIEYFQHCPFCEAGDCDDDGGDSPHTEECPLFGFDMTLDVNALKAWAKT